MKRKAEEPEPIRIRVVGDETAKRECTQRVLEIMLRRQREKEELTGRS
jgi:hypothetical protein